MLSRNLPHCIYNIVRFGAVVNVVLNYEIVLLEKNNNKFFSMLLLAYIFAEILFYLLLL